MAKHIEGVEGAGEDALDSDIIIIDLEDRGTPWDKFAWGIWLGMVRMECEYGARWGGSTRATLT